MKIIKVSEPKVVMSNPTSHHNYFGWPTVARLKNGKIAVVASGFRLRHVCPFGKTVISYSEDEGKTFTLPAILFDTVLDDRDGGILGYGDKDAIVTSFTISREYFRSLVKGRDLPYDLAYIDSISPEEEKEALGSSFRISHDNGVTFGPIIKSPVSSPHGPTELSDGRLLWVGRACATGYYTPEKEIIEAHIINPDGTMEKIGEIPNLEIEGENIISCEPYAIELDDGRIIAHIRMDNSCNDEKEIFTVYQSESSDGGVTWTYPRKLLENRSGAPAHIMKHSSGALISTYGRRCAPYGIRAMISTDNGKTWETEKEIYTINEEYYLVGDLGYPSSVELSDGSIMTVFYTRKPDESAIIMQQTWKFEE